MTLLNGQESVLSFGSDRQRAEAVRLTVKPVVTGERRYVNLALKFDDRSATGPIQKSIVVPPVVVVPDGGTVVLAGYQKSWDKPEEVSVPVISEIPYLNRLFRSESAAPKRRRVLVLVTPRIIGE
jgi:type II secretory pathway component GspD/PulD (secretin)